MHLVHNDNNVIWRSIAATSVDKETSIKPADIRKIKMQAPKYNLPRRRRAIAQHGHAMGHNRTKRMLDEFRAHRTRPLNVHHDGESALILTGTNGRCWCVGGERCCLTGNIQGRSSWDSRDDWGLGGRGRGRSGLLLRDFGSCWLNLMDERGGLDDWQG